jgi:bifunctional DNA-binding transcriptional regulator/antitoxin component of YhaV-PrlF toxin-antitoxin module
MTQSTLTDRYQTTIPREVREALKLAPRQRVSYEVRDDGTAILRPVPRLGALFGSLKPTRAIAHSRAEKQAAHTAIAHEASAEGH